jgi:ABC-type nickel/cobalt efflux system permease component RcnA
VSARRVAAIAAVALGVVLGGAPVAQAHPLGNFSTNHLSVVRVSADRVDVRYVLDQAEIPTFRERGVPPGALLARKRAEAERGLELTVRGRRTPLSVRGPGRIAFPAGQGGLKTTRVELALTARVDARGAIVVRDGTFPGRVGWRAVVVRPGKGTAVRSSVPSQDPTRGLRAYPGDVLDDPADRRVARLSVGPGPGTVTAPDGEETAAEGAGRSISDGLTAAFTDAAAGEGVLVFLLLAAFGWGAVHALSPGHGKAMVAAYLVGTRGTARDALALGAIVTATHTIGVFALGLVTLALSAYVLPEQLYPWLNLASGLLVVLVGLAVLRVRVRGARGRRGRDDHHHHHDHHHRHAHQHHHHDGARHNHHQATRSTSPRELLAMGASAGLIPCPSALVVLLAAIAQAQVALGLTLIVAFSLGLAATLTFLGLAVVWAGGLAARVRLPPRLRVAVTALPALSAVVIVVAGAVLTAQALPDLI